MLKLKVLMESKDKKLEKESYKQEDTSISNDNDEIMLPDTVVNKKRFIKYMKDVYNAEVKFK